MGRPGGRIGLLLGCAVIVLAGLPSLAAAELPRTYQVARVDSPNPVVDGRFGLQLANVGDINGDGRDELLTGTDKHGAQPGTGQVAVLDGADPAGPPLRVYTQPDGDANAGGTDRQAGFGNQIGRLADLDGDGVDEHIVASSGIDTAAGIDLGPEGNDLGVVYVFDGASGDLLKRLVMPAADRTEQVSGVSTDPNNDPRFGRTVLNPAGLAPCDENGAAAFGGPGIAPCPPTLPSTAILNGDVTGDDVGDVVVGATDYSEVKGTAHPESECATQAGAAECAGAGRVYVYSGADFTGDPATLLEPVETIKSPLSQPDQAQPPSPFSNDEAFGIQVIPIGDAGSCGDAAADPGDSCAAPSNTLDGKPEFAIVANAVDLFGFSDVGESLEYDGAKLTEIKDTEYPEPRIDSSWGIAQNGTMQPPLGDVAGSTAPDYYVSDIQYNGAHQAQGRGLVINGQPSTNGSFREFPSRFIDPTPQNSEQFGLAAAGLGPIKDFLDERGEIAIGAIGPHNPGTNASVVNDVHIFDPATELALQTVAAPDAQGGETFGASVQPMGDLNGDGFLDLAVGAGFYDLTTAGPPCAVPCGNAGRVYFFLSDNSQPPVQEPPVQEPPPQPPAEQPIVRTGRSLEVGANKDEVKKGKRVRILGLLESLAGDQSCATDQLVQIQRRRPGKPNYANLRELATDADGTFSTRFRVKKTHIYRARASETEACLTAISNPERVEALKRKKKR